MVYLLFFLSLFGCSKLFSDAEVYLKVVDAKASSFDQTPEWAPEPSAMNAFDGDMSTRWASSSEAGEQWVVFDFGEERTVSSLIIRWERAYAKKYRLFASTDGKTWKDVYNDANGLGGISEIAFNPEVVCRYMKLLLEERFSKSWGVSIWEIEAYGPRNKNSKATISKDDYLKQRTEKIENELSAAAAPVVSLKDKLYQRGADVTFWEDDQQEMQNSARLLLYIKSLGLDSVAFIIPGHQVQQNATVIHAFDKESKQDRSADEKLRYLVGTARKLGLRVMIKPHIDLPSDVPRTEIVATNDWFKSYSEFILRYAKLANEYEADVFAVGTELEKTTQAQWTAHWRALISEVRKVFNGTLTYAANWTEYQQIEFWPELDFIGIDAYFPLSSNPHPQLADLVAGWEKNANEIEKWLYKQPFKDKKIVFTEIGYASTTGAADQPWLSLKGRSADQDVQAMAYQAFFGVLPKRPWFKGFYIWHLYPLKNADTRGFPIQGKKAAEIIKQNDLH